VSHCEHLLSRISLRSASGVFRAVASTVRAWWGTSERTHRTSLRPFRGAYPRGSASDAGEDPPAASSSMTSMISLRQYKEVRRRLSVYLLQLLRHAPESSRYRLQTRQRILLRHRSALTDGRGVRARRASVRRRRGDFIEPLENRLHTAALGQLETVDMRLSMCSPTLAHRFSLAALDGHSRARRPRTPAG
jgi:hypothetical protein